MWTITDANDLEDAIFRLKLKLAEEIGVREKMTVVDVGCGQGGFTASVAKTVGPRGRVIAVDESDEYLPEFSARLDRYGVRERVTFVQKDAADLRDVVSDESADMAVSYRLLEELKHRESMAGIAREMARIVKGGGRVVISELSVKARNRAEEVYLRLHRESGDCFFDSEEVCGAMKRVGLRSVRTRMFETNVWFSPELARQDLGFAQVWFDEVVEKSLGPLIERHGMKYPALRTFSGVKV